MLSTLNSHKTQKSFYITTCSHISDVGTNVVNSFRNGGCGVGVGGDPTFDCSAVAEIRTKTKLPSTVGRKWACVGRQMTVLGRDRKRREGDKGKNGTKKKKRKKGTTCYVILDGPCSSAVAYKCWMRSVIWIFKATVKVQMFLAVQMAM